jgi:hypothetical protein
LLLSGSGLLNTYSPDSIKIPTGTGTMWLLRLPVIRIWYRASVVELIFFEPRPVAAKKKVMSATIHHATLVIKSD